MGDSWGRSGDHTVTDMVELMGKVMAVAIILLFFIVVFFLCLHLYFKWFYHHRDQLQTPSPTIMQQQQRRLRRRRLDFAAGHQEIVVVGSSRINIGLEPHVLKSIPVVAFHSAEFKDGLECAVCLCEVCEGENARILPKCNHGFHVECIDMWFQSHATCPLCRNPVSKSDDSEQEEEEEDYSSSSETHINAFGPCMDEDHHHLDSPPLDEPSTSASSSTSSSPNVMVVIDILV